MQSKDGPDRPFSAWLGHGGRKVALASSVDRKIGGPGTWHQRASSRRQAALRRGPLGAGQQGSSGGNPLVARVEERAREMRKSAVARFARPQGMFPHHGDSQECLDIGIVRLGLERVPHKNSNRSMLPFRDLRSELEVPTKRAAVQPSHFQPDLLFLSNRPVVPVCKELVPGQDALVEASPSPEVVLSCCHVPPGQCGCAEVCQECSFGLGPARHLPSPWREWSLPPRAHRTRTSAWPVDLERRLLRWRRKAAFRCPLAILWASGPSSRNWLPALLRVVGPR